MDQQASTPPDPIQREQAMFAAALKHAPEERAVFLDGACHGDPKLRQRLETLLAANDDPDSLLPEDLTADATHDRPFHDEAVGQTLGRYKLLERVGEGGYGVVYVAEQTEPVRRRVALKVIKLGMDTKQVVARFEAERQALALMDHPNIAKVLDAGTTDQGRPYFVMELVRGIKITDYCDQEKMNTKDRLNLFIKVCHAIQHAHQKGIIHRDIKPSNILVTLHDGVPIPKVIDFGIAKATEGRLTDATVYTQLHQFIGTPAYMSPEQAEMSGLDIDTRSDIYSLGVLLYELLIGKTPFDGKELVSMGIDAMRKTIRESEPARPSTRLATLLGEELTSTATRRSSEISTLAHLLKGDLDWIVMKCLEKDRQRRYETANALAADIKRHLGNEPIVARPPSAIYKFQKAWRRNKLVYSSGTAVLLALLLGIGFSLHQMSIAIKASEDAKTATEDANKARLAKEVEAKEAQEQRDKAIKANEEANRSKQESIASALKARLNLYAADMYAAHVLIKEGNFGAARSLLERHKPVADDDSRGFEWRYLASQLKGDYRLIGTHQNTICDMDFPPDHEDVLWAMDIDGDLVQWDLTSHSPIRSVQSILPSGYPGMHVSKEIIGLFGLDEGNIPVTRFFSIPTNPKDELKLLGNELAYSFDFSPDDKRIVLVRPDYRVEMRDIGSESTTEILSPLIDVPDWEKAAAGKSLRVRALVRWSDDGEWIIVSGPLRKLRAKNLTTGKTYESNTTDESVFWECPNLLSDQSTIATAGSAGLELWSIEQDTITLKTTGINRNWNHFALSSGSPLMAIGGFDHSVRVWDLRNPYPQTVLHGHQSEVWSVLISKDGRTVYSGGQDRQILRWDLKVQHQGTSILRLSSDILEPVFSNDGQWLAVGQASGHGALIHLISKNKIDLPVSGDPVGFSRDNHFLFMAEINPLTIDNGHQRHTGQLFKIALGQPDTPIRIPKAFDMETGEYWPAPPDRAFFRDAEKNTLTMVDLESGTIISPQKTPSSSTELHAELSPDNRTVVCWKNTGEDGRSITIHDVLGNSEAQEIIVNGLRGLANGAFSPDGTYFAAACLDSRVFIWQTKDWKIKENGILAGHKRGTFDVSFSPDGKTLASGNDDGTVKLWNVATGGLMLSIDLEAAVWKVRFSPDGQHVIVCCTPPLEDTEEIRIFYAPDTHALIDSQGNLQTGRLHP